MRRTRYEQSKLTGFHDQTDEGDMIERCLIAEDSGRCQGITAAGQCWNLGNLQADGTRNAMCLIHDTNQEKKAIAQSARNYRLTKFRAQLERHASSDKIKDLREEIGILRMMLEEKINSCADATDMVLMSGPISDMVLKIEKLVASCHKLEGSMGQLLDKQAILQFASEVIGIIADEIKDTSSLEVITNRILESVSRVGKMENTDESI